MLYKLASNKYANSQRAEFAHHTILALGTDAEVAPLHQALWFTPSTRRTARHVRRRGSKRPSFNWVERNSTTTVVRNSHGLPVRCVSRREKVICGNPTVS